MKAVIGHKSTPKCRHCDVIHAFINGVKARDKSVFEVAGSKYKLSSWTVESALQNQIAQRTPPTSELTKRTSQEKKRRNLSPKWWRDLQEMRRKKCPTPTAQAQRRRWGSWTALPGEAGKQKKRTKHIFWKNIPSAERPKKDTLATYRLDLEH